MPSTYTDTTVGQLVADKPRRSKIFERFGIDYCCGGKKSIEEACKQLDLDAEQVIRELQALDSQSGASEEVSWKQRSMTELADHIEQTHHAYLREALPRIGTLTQKVARVHGQNHPEVVDVNSTFEGLREELESHMAKEENILFPMIREMDKARGMLHFHCGSVRNPISVMEHEHQSAGDALSRMHELTGGYVPPADACGTCRAMLDALSELEGDLHVHIHKENEILFPRAAERERELAKTCEP